MAYLKQTSSTIADCSSLLISMWVRTPVGQPTGTLLSFGYTPPSPYNEYIQTRWNFLGTFGPSDVPPGEDADDLVNAGPISVGNYNFTQNGYDRPRSTIGNAAQMASGPWDPPPIIYDTEEPFRPTYEFTTLEPDTQWPVAWNGLSGRWWGKYFTPGTPPTFSDAGFHASPDGGPKAPGTTCELWEVGFDDIFGPQYNIVPTNQDYSSLTLSGGATPQLRFTAYSGVTADPGPGVTVGTVTGIARISVPDSFASNYTPGQWHHVLIAIDLTGGTMGSSYATPKNHTMYMVINGVPVSGSGTSVAKAGEDYSVAISQLDHDPAWEAAAGYPDSFTTPPYQPPGHTGKIRINTTPFWLPYDGVRAAGGYQNPPDIGTDVSPTVNPVEYGPVQMWFGTYADPTDPAVFAKFVSLTTVDDVTTGRPQPASVARAAFGTPDVEFLGNKDSFPTNRGSAGSFTKLNTINNFTPGPSY